MGVAFCHRGADGRRGVDAGGPFRAASARGTATRTDWAGTALLVIGLVSLLLAISQGGQLGLVFVPVLGLFLLAAVSLSALAFVELRTTTPLIDMRTLARPALAVTNGITLFVGFIPYIFYIGLPALLQAPRHPDRPRFHSDRNRTRLAARGDPGVPGWPIRAAADWPRRLQVHGDSGVAVMASGHRGGDRPDSIAMVVAFFSLVGLGNGLVFPSAPNSCKSGSSQRSGCRHGCQRRAAHRRLCVGGPDRHVILATVAVSESGAATMSSFSMLFLVAAAVSAPAPC